MIELTGIFNGLQAIIDTLLGPLRWITFIIREIYQFGNLILATIETIVENVLTMPTVVMNYAILSISVIVIMRLVGRSTK